jgi:hypothetical protein
MTRTTLDLDPGLLRELRERGLRERKSMGTIASELIAAGLGAERSATPRPLQWRSKPMGARVDLEDKETVWRILDGQ